MSVDISPPTPLWARASADALQPTHAMQTAREWLASSAWGLLMLGGVGRGKSQAAAWLWLRLRHLDLLEADDAHRSRRGVTWLRARALQNVPWEERAATLRRCATAYGLVVDELGGEDERTGQAIGDVLEQRGDEQRRTVMTSNLDGKGFLERYGDRLVSRLRSGGVTIKGGAQWAVLVQGADLRGSDLPPSDDPETIEQGRPASPEFMARELAKEAPEVAAMLGPLVEAARAAGGWT
jgi:hypothetical protein